MPDRMLDLGTKSINETEFDMLWMSVCDSGREAT